MDPAERHRALDHVAGEAVDVPDDDPLQFAALALLDQPTERAVVDGRRAGDVKLLHDRPDLDAVPLGPVPRRGLLLLGRAEGSALAFTHLADPDVDPEHADLLVDGPGRSGAYSQCSRVGYSVKTVCTTNCSWALTTKMATALVEQLGDPAPDGRRAFPSAAAMAAPDEAFYREVVRSGYRAPYLRALAASVATGEVDLESLADPELPDDEAEARLLALPGIGPYGAAHVMLTSLGRYSRLVLDSWTRPTYASLAGRKAKDSTIERRFRRYREWAGLAFWLYLTRSWVKEET